MTNIVVAVIGSILSALAIAGALIFVNVHDVSSAVDARVVAGWIDSAASLTSAFSVQHCEKQEGGPAVCRLPSRVEAAELFKDVHLINAPRLVAPRLVLDDSLPASAIAICLVVDANSPALASDAVGTIARERYGITLIQPGACGNESGLEGKAVFRKVLN